MPQIPHFSSCRRKMSIGMSMFTPRTSQALTVADDADSRQAEVRRSRGRRRNDSMDSSSKQTSVKVPHFSPSGQRPVLLFVCLLLFTTAIVETFATVHFAGTTNQSVHHGIVKRQTLQRFLVEPDNVTLTIGQSVTLPCKVSNKSRVLQWTRDGFGLGTDPKLDGFPTYSMVQNEATGDYSLKISSVTLEDDAVFQCQIGASANVPGIRSQSAHLTVQVPPEPPVIVHSGFVNAPNWASSNQQIFSTTVGSKVELICEAYGARPAAELTWLNGKNRAVKKGIESTITPMNDGKRSNAALKWTFEPSKSDHGKKLYCRATHPAQGNATMASITLEVKFAPEVKVEVSRVPARNNQNNGGNNVTTSSPHHSTTSTATTTSSSLPAGAHGRVGDSLKIKCAADGNPGKDQLVYQWFKDDQVIAEADSRPELVIERVDKHWNGVEVRCQVTNSVGVGKSSVRLNIAYGPEFSPEMQYVYGASSGETVRLACPVESNPSSEITWIRVGSSSVILNTGSKLTIKNMGVDHVGEYLCRASVKGFPEISAIVYLRLNGPPKIRKGRTGGGSGSSGSSLGSGGGSSSNVNHAVIGEPGHIHCLVESVPPPIAITWIHNGQVFTSNSANNKPNGISVHESIVDAEPVFTKASFDIRVTEQQNYGYYNCVVINKYGSDWHLVELSEQTSFATIASVTLILIAILLVIVLLTVIVILLGKHRRLVKAQALQKEQQQLSENQLKNAYLDDSDNLNLYSTTASTRTNSSSDKEKQRCDGSPRSSSSSFVPYLHDDAEHLNGLGAQGLGMDPYGHHMSGQHPHQQSLSPAGYHFHTVYSPDSPSPFYNPYSMNESPYHFSPNHQPVNAYHSHRNHFPSHVSMQSEHPAHQFVPPPTHMSGLLNSGCEAALSYSSMAMKAFELPSNDSIYQANLYQVSPKPSSLLAGSAGNGGGGGRASSVRSDQSPAHGQSTQHSSLTNSLSNSQPQQHHHHSPSPQTDNNNGLHV